MNHIQKRFLNTQAQKLIPFQMLKTNYGFSSADGADLIRAGLRRTETENTVVLTSLPENSSFVAIALRIPDPSDTDQTLKVVSIGTSPPLSTELGLAVPPGDPHYIYVLSNDYEDGYVNQETPTAGLVAQNVFAVDSANPALFRREITVAAGGAAARIPLRFTRAQNQSDWFNYEDNYRGDPNNLLWEDPRPPITIAGDIPREDSYSYLAYQLTLLEGIYQAFQDGLDLQGEQGRAAFEDLIDGASLRAINTESIPLRMALQLQEGLTRSVLIIEDWENDLRLINSVDGANTINELTAKLVPSQYRSDVHALIGDAPERQSPTDTTPEYRMDLGPEQAMAGYATIVQYVVDAYNSDNNSRTGTFNGTFSRAGIQTATISTNRRQELEALARTTRAALVASPPNSDSSPVVNDESFAVYSRLQELVRAGSGSDSEIGTDVLQFVAERTSVYGEALSPLPSFRSMYVDPFADETGPAIGAIVDIVNTRAFNLLSYAKRKLAATEEFIGDLGDFTFVPPPDLEGEPEGPQLAHEATLQNIRFLRYLFEETTDDIWSQTSTFNGFILDSIVALRNEVIGNLSRSNSITTITQTDQVRNEDLEVLWARIDNATGVTWTAFRGPLINLGNGVKAVDVGSLNRPGQYVLMIRPRSIEIVVDRIPEADEGSVIETASLNQALADNYFYGWNIEFDQPGDQALPLGEQRMIVGSEFNTNNTRLLISPNITNRPDFVVDSPARIWPNTFIPILCDLEIAEHTIDTLAYANYGKREFNKRTGTLTIYDFAGRPFKRLSLGERATADEGFDPIEFRDPQQG